MKNVSIITLSGNNNFGNKLQSYALQEILKSMNLNVKLIWISSAYDGNICRTVLRNVKIKIFNDIFSYKRTNIFKKFNKDYLNYDKKKIHFYTKLNKFDNYYNYFVVGSDQVWNYFQTKNFSVYFLDGIEYNKKISYAASFGISKIPEQYKNIYKEKIMSFNKISVREKQGENIIKELTGRNDVEVLIDPTMLLKAEKWDKVAKKPKQLGNKKYILNYFLGNLSESRKKEIERIADENNCEIINILDKKDPFYVSGPSEFLYLEKNAFLICTDSFHSCVFSILFDRPFIVFDREQEGVQNMNSRIDTLINKFKLENRRFNGKNITKENLEHDYTEAYKTLEEERKKSNEFLRKALDIEE